MKLSTPHTHSSPYSIRYTSYSILTHPHTPYSILHTLYFLLPILYTLYFILYTFIAPPLASASTDPQSATASATATIPSTTPTTSDTTAPTAPILVSPPDATVLGDDTPEFVWRQSSDTNSNTIYYTFYLNEVATYIGIADTGSSTGPGYTAWKDGTEVKLIPTSPLSDGTYSWRVTASDLAGNAASSVLWHFTLDTIPPVITITDIDIYHNLSLSSDHPEDFAGIIFDISGPKDVYFTIHSEPWSTLTLQFYNESTGELVSHSMWTVSDKGLVYPYTHLDLGRYLVSIVGYDRGGSTTALPQFILSIVQAQITVPLPPFPGLPPSYSIPYTPYSIPSLPATISKIESRLLLFTIIGSLLAIVVLVLLIFIWKRKYNLILLNGGGAALTNTKVYHSIPTSRSKHSSIFVTSLTPISYFLSSSDHGRLYIRHLGRYSTLTIRTDSTTYILSLCAHRRLYTITI